MNPFVPLYERCNSGDPAEKYADLENGPIMVDIEPTGLCNFRCSFCPTGLLALGRPGGMMTLDTFRAVLNGTEPFDSAIRFIGWGEPLMNPNIVEMVEWASIRGRLTHLNTNASKLTRELAERLVDAGLSSIKFSFQGTDRETYRVMRQTDFFQGMLKAIDMMRLARGAGTKPYIAASTTTTDETDEQITVFIANMTPLVDELSVGHTIFEFIDMAAVPEKQRERLKKAAAAQTVVKKHPVPCPEVFHKLTIHWNGAVRVCCNDYSGKTNLGNINTDDMASIWRHATMEAYREKLAKKDYSSPLCETCFDYLNCTKEQAA